MVYAQHCRKFLISDYTKLTDSYITHSLWSIMISPSFLQAWFLANKEFAIDLLPIFIPWMLTLERFALDQATGNSSLYSFNFRTLSCIHLPTGTVHFPRVITTVKLLVKSNVHLCIITIHCLLLILSSGVWYMGKPNGPNTEPWGMPVISDGICMKHLPHVQPEHYQCNTISTTQELSQLCS